MTGMQHDQVHFIGPFPEQRDLGWVAIMFRALGCLAVLGALAFSYISAGRFFDSDAFDWSDLSFAMMAVQWGLLGWVLICTPAWKRAGLLASRARIVGHGFVALAISAFFIVPSLQRFVELTGGGASLLAIGGSCAFIALLMYLTASERQLARTGQLPSMGESN